MYSYILLRRGVVSSRIRCRTRHPQYFENQSSIPFELNKVNIGGAMNSSSGVFTAPRNGRYFFSLSGVAKFASNSTGYIGVALRVNASPIGRGHTEGNVGIKGYQTFSLQSTLDLKARDKVWLEIDYLGFHNSGV